MFGLHQSPHETSGSVSAGTTTFLALYMTFLIVSGLAQTTSTKFEVAVHLIFEAPQILAAHTAQTKTHYRIP